MKLKIDLDLKKIDGVDPKYYDFCISELNKGLQIVEETFEEERVKYDNYMGNTKIAKNDINELKQVIKESLKNNSMYVLDLDKILTIQGYMPDYIDQAVSDLNKCGDIIIDDDKVVHLV